MAKRKVAKLVVGVLVEAGVERIYGVAGDSLNRITDIIRTGRRAAAGPHKARGGRRIRRGRRSASHGQIGSLRRKLRTRKCASDVPVFSFDDNEGT